jgi:hypothetical protein
MRRERAGSDIVRDSESCRRSGGVRLALVLCPWLMLEQMGGDDAVGHERCGKAAEEDGADGVSLVRSPDDGDDLRHGAQLLCGDRDAAVGELASREVAYRPTGPRAAIARGIAYLSEERKADGFIPMLAPLENVALPVMQRFERFGVLRRRQVRAAASTALAGVDVRGRVDGKMTAPSRRSADSRAT